MTALLDKVYQEALQLSEVEQNVVAARWLDELSSERRWEHSFADSEDELAGLASEALQADKDGKTAPLNMEKL